MKDRMMVRNTTLLIRLIWGVVLSFVLSISGHTQTAQQIAQMAFKSTVMLIMEDTNGNPVSLGSGFFVSDDQIPSNLHVTEGASRGYAKIVGQHTKYDIEGITAIDPEKDLVIFKISTFRAPTLILGDSDAVQVGDTIYAIGNPLGLEGTFSQGIVSGIRNIGNDKLLQITAPISPGSSGGPVLNNKGEVIGVSVATCRGGQNLNFAIPSNYLKTLLEKTGPAKPLAQVKPTKVQRSILADLGGRSSEGVIGENFIWDSYYNFGFETTIGGYSFSLRNQLRESVKNVYCLVIFYDERGNPIDTNIVRYEYVIPAGLARRVGGRVHHSVQKLTTLPGSIKPRTKIEFRILNFEIFDR